jgi:very-short-patch-repair endonuclease
MPYASKAEIKRARQLRTAMTDAELRLWMRLRGKQIELQRFRRQVPIGPYVADFLCGAARLIVEVDGGQHTTNSAHDDRRTAWLESQGFKVVRFWDNDVLLDTDSVVDSIRTQLLALTKRDSPYPALPQRGRET